MSSVFKNRLWIPNSVTFLENILALSAIAFAVTRHDRRAAVFIFAAGICDAIDGPLARRFQAQSRFGNIYDSMSDFPAFGVAPAISLWVLGLLHPIVAAFYVLCIQFRLARYSALPEMEQKEGFFRGLAAPDAVYIGILIGLVPGSDFSIGFAIAGLLALYPGRLWPKGGRILKILVAAVALFGFLRGA